MSTKNNSTKSEYICAECRGANVEICLPAHFELNDGFKLVSIDEEADALTYWCRDCDEDVPVISFVDSDEGQIEYGRW